MTEYSFVATFMVANIVEIVEGSYSIGLLTWLGYLLLLAGAHMLFNSEEPEISTKLPLYAAPTIVKNDYTKSFYCMHVFLH